MTEWHVSDDKMIIWGNYSFKPSVKQEEVWHAQEAIGMMEDFSIAQETNQSGTSSPNASLEASSLSLSKLWKTKIYGSPKLLEQPSCCNTKQTAQLKLTRWKWGVDISAYFHKDGVFVWTEPDPFHRLDIIKLRKKSDACIWHYSLVSILIKQGCTMHEKLYINTLWN